MNTNAVSKELEESCRNAEKTGEETLLTLIRKNEDTVFGREHFFRSINSVDEYRQTVPLSDYNSYKPYIERMRKGEADILTSYKVIGFCVTSGTTDEPKYIPVTDMVFERYPLYISKFKKKILSETGGKRFSVNFFRSDLSKPIGNESIFSEFLYRYYYDKGLQNHSDQVGGDDLFFITEKCSVIYAKAWAALLSADITMIESVYMYEIIRFFGYIEKNWESILDDIKARRISEKVYLPENLRSFLLSMPADEKRIREIYEACSSSFDGIARKLWKNLRLICGASAMTSITENSLVEYYIGDVPCYRMIYAASECVMGTAVGENEYGYVIVPDCGFFEFLPYCEDNDNETGETVLPHELRVGGEYEIVITNLSGFYRYRLGDVLRVVGFIGQSPVVEFMFRKNQVLNIAGEKTVLAQIEQAMEIIRGSGTQIEDYRTGICIDKDCGCYTTVILTKDGSECTTEQFDKALTAVNSDYEDLRQLTDLDPPMVFTTSDRNLFDRIVYSCDKENACGHNKPRHIFNEVFDKKKWKELINHAERI